MAAALSRGKKWLVAGCWPLLALLWVTLFSYSGWGWRYPFDDLLDRLLPRAPLPASIVIVDIDERSLNTLGPWPWPREVQARLIEALRAAGVRLQVWDLLWVDEPLSGTDQLLEQLKGSRDLVAAMVPVLDQRVPLPPRNGALPQAPSCTAQDLQARGYLAPAREIAEAVPLGHVAPQFDADGKLRRLPAWVCVDGRRIALLPLAALAQLDPERARRYERLEQLALVRPPPFTAWSTVPADLILASAVDPERLAGAIAIVGSTALGVGDRLPTAEDPITPGVAIHAALLASLMNGSSPQPAPQWLLLAITFFAALPLIASQRLLPFLAAPLALTASLVGAHLTQTPVSSAPLLAVVATHLIVGATQLIRLIQERRRLRHTLSALLPAPLAQALLAAPPQALSYYTHPRCLVAALRLRNLERLSERPLLLLAYLDATARLLDQQLAPYAPRLYCEGVGEWRILFAADAPGHQVSALLARFADHLQQTFDAEPLPTDPPVPIGIAVALVEGLAIEAVIGRGSTMSRYLAGEGPAAAQALAALASDWGERLLLPAAIFADLPLPPGWHPAGQTLIPGERSPVALVGYSGQP